MAVNFQEKEEKISTMHVREHSQNSMLETMELLHLASPPHVIGRLLDICYNPTSTIEQLASVIATDCALSSKVLMAVNAKVFAKNPATLSLKQTISLLGREHIQTLAITSSIKQLFSGYSHAHCEFLCSIWLESIYSAIFAENIAIATAYANPQDAYTAGLLYKLGQLALDAKYHKKYNAIASSKSAEELLHKENTEFGINHAQLGCNIIRQWPSLHPSIADAILFYHKPKELLKDSDQLCQIIAEASLLSAQWSETGMPEEKWQSTILDGQQTENLYLQIKKQMGDIATLTQLPQLSSSCITKQQIFKNIDQDNINLAQKIRDKSLIKALDSSPSQRAFSNSPAELLIKVTREMQLLFSLSDVVLLFPDQNTAEYLELHELNCHRVVSRFPLQGNNSSIVKSFTQREVLWIDGVTSEEKNLAISDQQILHRVNHELALTLPLINTEKNLGVVVIGCNSQQKNSLQKQSNLISNYLNSVAEQWLHNIQDSPVINTDKENEQKLLHQLIHEISNPLSVIGNYIDILKRKEQAEDNPEPKELAIVKEELQRVRNIITNFGSDEVTSTPSLFLNTELANCIPLYIKSNSDKTTIDIKWDLDKIDAQVDISRDSLRQIILNLVKNAIEAQTENFMIMVSSHHFVNTNGTSFAQFTISDKGNGVDAELLPKLFSPVKSSKPGDVRGIGLSIVAELLARFNGQIKYLENQFGGASFEVLIPLNAATHSSGEKL